jgi:CheY-like chemotaxis protein
VNIIYIDDDATNRALLRDMLAIENIPVAEAGDARTGLKMIEEGSYDLIFMDLRMPDMNGLTAIRQLRAGGQAAVPIVVVTADPSEGVKAMCRSAGATDFLEKPIAMDRLFEMVAAFRKKVDARTPG